jgi:hypothetical protein
MKAPWKTGAFGHAKFCSVFAGFFMEFKSSSKRLLNHSKQ